MANKILSYSALWDFDDQKGSVTLEYEKGKFKTLESSDSNQVLLALDMLRNEGPVYLDLNRNYIRLGKEPVGTWDKRKKPDN